MFGELLGPDQVSVWLPVYPLATLPYMSSAVTVALNVEPAVAGPGVESDSPVALAGLI